MTTCPHCRVGALHRKTITYANWHFGYFVTAPNTPVWQCDVCASCEIDAAALQRLLWLLGPTTPAGQAPAQRRQQSSGNEPQLDNFDPDRQTA